MAKPDEKSTTCPDCGAEMVRDERDAVLRYRGQTRTIRQTGWYCLADGETVVLDEADEARWQEKVDAFSQDVDQSLGPILSEGPRCLDCGGEAVRDVRQTTWTFHGKPLTYAQPGWYCLADAKHESLHSVADTEATEGLLFAHRATILQDEGDQAVIEAERAKRPKQEG